MLTIYVQKLIIQQLTIYFLFLTIVKMKENNQHNEILNDQDTQDYSTISLSNITNAFMVTLQSNNKS